MKLPRIDFITLRDPKGYEIKQETPQEIAKARAESEAFAKTIGINLEAMEERPKAQLSEELRHYIDLDTPAGQLEKSGPWISGHIVGLSGKSGKLKMEHVDLSQWPRAYEEFANVNAPDGLLGFVTKYGPLYIRRQDVLPLLKQARLMRQCMRGTIEPYNIRNLSAALYRDRETDKFEISITPSCLLDALWLQFHNTESSGAVFRVCPYCKTPFAAGGDSGRLRNAEFCSPEHRKRFNSLKRSNPKMRKIRERHK
jgi:hypothetical protein